MNKEIISDKQGISLVITFIIGTSVILITGFEAKQDLWISTLLSIAMACPILLLCARLHHLFPDKDLFDMLEICFGKIIGKGIAILYTFFSFYLTALLLRDFGEFAVTTSLRETPIIVLMIFSVILGIWLVKEGIEVIARWTEFFLPIIIGLIIVTMLLLLPHMNIKHIFPVFSQGISPILQGAFTSFSFPFAEPVIFIMVFSTFKHEKSSYKIYLGGLFIGGIIILTTSLANILVLGVGNTSSLYFPSYSAVSLLKIGQFLQRIEILVSFEFVIGGFVKMSICFLASCIGISKILGYKDYRFLVVPIGLLLINFSYFVSDNTTDFFEWSLKIWKYFAFPFQVIFPILLFIFAEIRKKGYSPL